MMKPHYDPSPSSGHDEETVQLRASHTASSWTFRWEGASLGRQQKGRTPALGAHLFESGT